MMISRSIVLGVAILAIAITECSAQTCYVDGTASCEELTQGGGYSCEGTDCEPFHSPIGGTYWGDFCPQGEKNVNLNGPVNVAVHEDYGLDSTSTGGTVQCVSEQDCKRFCGFQNPGETVQCEGEGAWTDSEPYSHTYAAGNECDLFGGF